MHRFVIAFILTLALPAQAATPSAIAPVLNRLKFTAAGATCPTQDGSCKVLSAVALNASAGSRTFTLPVSRYAKTVVQVDLTRTAATDLQLTCTGSLNGGATYGEIASTSISAGVGTMSAYRDVFALTTSRNILFEYDTRNYDSFRCVVSGTSGGAADTINVYASSAVGQ
jgi:hypothetical protein